MKIADVMAKRFEIKTQSAYVGSTSISVHGKYLKVESEKVEPSLSENKQKKNEIVSKNHRNQAGRFILATNLLDKEINSLILLSLIKKLDVASVRQS